MFTVELKNCSRRMSTLESFYLFIHFLLFLENITSLEQEIYSENKRKRCTISYRLKLSGVDIGLYAYD